MLLAQMKQAHQYLAKIFFFLATLLGGSPHLVSALWWLQAIYN